MIIKLVRVTITIASDLLKQIDRSRGAINRSRFVGHLMKKGLKVLEEEVSA